MQKRVVINRTYSEWRKVTSGIPYGSVLAPIFFLIFINEMPEVLNSCIKLFADDAKLYSPIKEQNDRIRVQVGLKMLKIGQNSSISKKCKYLHIEKNHPDTQYIMSLEQSPTEVMRVTNEEDIDVIINDK